MGICAGVWAYARGLGGDDRRVVWAYAQGYGHMRVGVRRKKRQERGGEEERAALDLLRRTTLTGS